MLSSLAMALALACPAQEHGDASSRLSGYMAPGMEVAGIRAPYYDDEGRLKAQLFGGHAKVLDDGATEIANLRIDVYEGDRVAMTIFAPRCTSQVGESSAKPGKQVLAVSSGGEVLIELDAMTISGRGFRFNSENNRFEILQDSKVLVKATARKARGAGL